MIMLLMLQCWYLTAGLPSGRFSRWRQWWITILWLLLLKHLGVLSKAVLRLLRSFTKRLLNGLGLKISRRFHILLAIFLIKDKRHNLEFGYKVTTLPTHNRKIKRSTLGYDFLNNFSRIKDFQKQFSVQN